MARGTSFTIALSLFLAMTTLAFLPVIASAGEDVELVQSSSDQFVATDHGAHGRKLLGIICGSTKCGFNQICCRKVCTNSFSDKNNCGSCGKKCSKVCQFGFCDYGIGKF